MLLATGHARLDLADDEVVRLSDACDSRIRVVRGFAWITVEGDRQDVVLGAGESYVVDTSDQVTISALRGAAAVTVHDGSGELHCAPSDRAHPSAAEVRHAALPSRLRGLLTRVSLSSVSLA